MNADLVGGKLTLEGTANCFPAAASFPLPAMSRCFNDCGGFRDPAAEVLSLWCLSVKPHTRLRQIGFTAGKQLVSSHAMNFQGLRTKPGRTRILMMPVREPCLPRR